MIFNLQRTLIRLVILILILRQQVQGQTNNVSPKLDFDDTDENNNSSSVPLIPGVGNGRSDGHNSNNNGGGGGNGGGSNGSNGSGSNSNGNSGKSGPKIHGVRVTVDTGDSKKSKESKESVEITDLGKNKKRVGIHTDITFEITADGEDVNGTSSSERKHNRRGSVDSDEDASVPIFKGRGSSGSKSRKHYDPKNKWTPNYSNEHPGYETGRTYPVYGGYYPNYQPNVPVYTGSHDTETGTGTIYRTRDGWTSFVPSTWTTERSYSEYYRPNTVSGQRSPTWKPCYCLQSGSEYRRRRDSQHNHEIFRPSSGVIQVIDSKIDAPVARK